MISGKHATVIQCLLTEMCVYTFLCSIVAAPPTAELEPLTDGQVSQTDEVSDDLDRDYKIAKICFFSQPSVQKPLIVVIMKNNEEKRQTCKKLEQQMFDIFNSFSSQFAVIINRSTNTFIFTVFV